jgi:Sulfatase
MTDDLAPRPILRSAAAARPRASLRPVVYPTLFAFAFVLYLFVASGASIFAGLRLLVASILVGLVVTVVCTFLVRDRHRGGLIALVVVLLLIAGNEAQKALALLLGIAALVVERIASSGKPSRMPWPLVTRVATFVGVIAVVAVGLKGAEDGTWHAAADELRTEGPSFVRSANAGTAPADAPDIYLVLLDGYARADKQLTLFGHDNTAFLDELRERGFEVAGNSRSNYLLTAVSLSSMFNLRYHEAGSELASLPVTDVRHVREARRLINDNEAFRRLRAEGYQTVAISSGFEEVSLRRADRFIDTGQLNEMELLTFRHTFLGPIVGAIYPDLFADQQRDRIRGVFSTADGLVDETASQPRFVFVHVPSPHAPVVFDAEGRPVEARDLPSFYEDSAIRRGISREEYAVGYTGQIEYLNGRTIALVDRIVAADPDAVVLVLSDHGSASGVAFGDWERSDLDERTANLFAARTPGRSDVFADDITLVNVFGRLFDAYIGSADPELPNRFFRWQGDSIFDVVEVPDVTRSAATTDD